MTYPLCKNGEQIKCNDGELLVPPGTKVNGTILFAQKAADKYSRPRLVLDFSNILHKNSDHSPLYARVIDVDNARETIRNNEILGIVQPHASTKVVPWRRWAMRIQLPSSVNRLPCPYAGNSFSR